MDPSDAQLRAILQAQAAQEIARLQMEAQAAMSALQQAQADANVLSADADPFAVGLAAALSGGCFPHNLLIICRRPKYGVPI